LELDFILRFVSLLLLFSRPFSCPRARVIVIQRDWSVAAAGWGPGAISKDDA
jgi:hypothetical protein